VRDGLLELLVDDQLQELGDFGLKLLFRHTVFNCRQNKSGMSKELTWGRRTRAATSAGLVPVCTEIWCERVQPNFNFSYTIKIQIMNNLCEFLQWAARRAI
jgi:hypothetical protein